MAPSGRVRWTRRSLADMDRIIAHISQDDPRAGHELARIFRARAENLRSHPYLGREVIPSGRRELIVHKNYLLTYRITNG